MFAKRPLFLENRDWYAIPEDEGLNDMFFPDGRGYHIRDDAPDEAKRSYEEYYSPEPMTDENGNSFVPDGCSAYY